MKKASPESRDVIWPFDGEIKASGLLRVRDYGYARQLYYKSRLRTRLGLLSIFGVILVVFGGLIYFIIDGWSELVFPATLLICLAYVVIIHPYVASWHLIRRFRSTGKDLGKWAFSQQGIHYGSGEADVHFKWSVVRQVIVTKRYVLLHLGTEPCHVFASPMFDSSASWRNFRAGIIRNFIGCRGCKYDLHGTVSDTCPECGKPIDSSVG